jgi:Bacterial Ig domain/Cadherin-like
MKIDRLFLVFCCFAMLVRCTPNTFAQPHLAVNNPLTISQGGTATIDSGLLYATDSEVAPSGVIFIINTNSIDGSGGPPREGVLMKNGVPLVSSSTFTMDDILNNRINYHQTINDCATEDDFQCSLTNVLGGVWSDQGHTSFTFRILITLVDRPPVVGNSFVTIPLGSTYNGACIATNPDCLNQTLRYSLITFPSKGNVTSFNTNNGAFTYLATIGQNGSDSFTFQVSDGVQFATQPGTFNLNIQIQPPTATSTTFTTQTGQPINATLSASDPNNPVQTLTYSVLSQGSKGTAVITNSATGEFIYMPQPGRFGSDTFTFKVNNGLYDSSSATVTVNILPRGLSQGNLILTAFSESGAFVALFNPVNNDAILLSSGGLLTLPKGVAYEPTGTVLVLDQNNGLIRLNPSTGAQTVLVGSTQLSNPVSVAEESSGTILVADPMKGLVRFSNTGTLLTNFPAGSLMAPAGVAVATNGQIFVADAAFFFGQAAGCKIVQIDPVTLNQTVISSTGLLTSPVSIAIEPDGNLLSAQFLDNSVVRISYPDGAQSTLTSGTNLNTAFGVAANASGHVFVSSANGAPIVEVNQVNGAQTIVGPNFVFSSLGIAVVGATAPPNMAGVMPLGAGQFLVRFTSAVGTGNTVLGTTNLLLPLTNWSVLGAATEASAGNFQFTDTNAVNQPARFYRVRSP